MLSLNQANIKNAQQRKRTMILIQICHQCIQFIGERHNLKNFIVENKLDKLKQHYYLSKRFQTERKQFHRI